MPRTRSDWIVLTLVAAVLGAVWIATTRVDPSAPALALGEPLPEVGHPAPDFTLQAPGGGEVRLSDLRGKPVVVNFWATWCPPCRAEIPALEQAHRDFGGDVVILGVDVQESEATVEAFMGEFGMSYPVALDPNAAVARGYQVRAYPTTVFVDSRGVIRHIFTGPLNEPLLYTRLTELMGH